MAAAHGAAAIKMADPATAVPIMAALIRADHGDKALKDRAAGLVARAELLRIWKILCARVRIV
jgi:hypothetical protein